MEEGPEASHLSLAEQVVVLTSYSSPCESGDDSGPSEAADTSERAPERL